MDAKNVWRWLERGLTGVVDMMLQFHGDPKSGTMPRQYVEQIEKAIGKLQQVVDQQKAR